MSDQWQPYAQHAVGYVSTPLKDGTGRVCTVYLSRLDTPHSVLQRINTLCMQLQDLENNNFKQSPNAQ